MNDPRVQAMFKRSRHNNLSIFIVSQGYHELPKKILVLVEYEFAKEEDEFLWGSFKKSGEKKYETMSRVITQGRTETLRHIKTRCDEMGFEFWSVSYSIVENFIVLLRKRK